MKRAITLDFICYAIILLFVYAALSKLFMYKTYVSDLGRQPLLIPYVKYLALTIPVSELIASVLLLIPKTRVWGLGASFVLMILFTGYVTIVVFSSQGHDLPCTCGGLIRELTWRQHFFFNVFYTLLTATALWLHYKNQVQWQKN